LFFWTSGKKQTDKNKTKIIGRLCSLQMYRNLFIHKEYSVKYFFMMHFTLCRLALVMAADTGRVWTQSYQAKLF